MPYAEITARWTLAALCAAGIAACASPTEALVNMPVAPAPRASVSAPVAAMAQPSAAPAVAAPSSAEAVAQVSPMVQRAFDDARRALRAGRTEEAQRAFLALTKSNPELGGPYANLGLIYGRAGKFAEAVAELEQAVRVSPRQPVYFNQLGIAYRQHGQFNKARDAYDKAIELDPGYAAPHLNLGILHDMYLGDAKHALELYARYLALSPGGDATVTKWVADLKNRKGDAVVLSKKEQP
jgi:Flp pilus assembly protein TadD